MRRNSVGAAILLLLSTGAGFAAEDGPTAPPNVVVILVDDLGYGDLSSYGAQDLRTPHIDRLVSQGMRLDNFYANCPVCSPTRAALLTGRYQESVGVPGVIRTHTKNSWGYLSAEAVLLPAVLKQAGYQTAIVGKWHLGLAASNLPNLRGFDFFHGFLGDMMDDYVNHRRHGINYMRRNMKEIDPPSHATDLFTAWACQWLQQQPAGKPFFLYLAYNAPHDPIQPPEEFLKRYRARHPEATEKRARLAALIEHLDQGIGQVLGTLEKTGQAKNTLVVFTSDNGGSLPAGATNGPLRDGKGTVFEGGIRVPMAARWPGWIAPGSRSDVMALSMDLFPTVLEAAGHAPPANLDGMSILPVLLGKTDRLPQRDLFWSRLESGVWVHAVRRGNFKLLRPRPNKPLELYDLAADPQETTNLAPQQAQRFAELEEALNAHIARFAQVPFRDPSGAGPGELRGSPGKQ